MPEYLTPGVYFDVYDTAPPAIRRIRTDIAAFVGLAERGPVKAAVRVESWRQFQAIYGNFVPYGYLGYAVKGFFDNGGRTCVVVRVAGATRACAEIVLKNAAGHDVIRIAASNDGVWGNRVAVVCTKINAARGTFSLMVIRDGREREVFADLSIHTGDPRHFVRMISVGEERRSRSRWILAERVTTMGLPDPDGMPDVSVSGLVDRTGWLAGGADGIASLLKTDFTDGLDVLKEIDIVAMVAVPDIHIQPTVTSAAPPSPPAPPADPCVPHPAAPAPYSPASATGTEQPPLFSAQDVAYVQQSMLEHCELLHDRIAIVEVPVKAGGQAFTPREARAWREQFDSPRGFAALYHPWIKVVDPLHIGGELVRAIPPSGHVAGAYAATDLSVGVHKAPANVELEWAEDVTSEIGDELQGVLNPNGINCLRPFPGRGIRIYGARTVSSDASWEFVNVRRLLMMIEEAIDESTQWSAFEPNDYNLRQKIVLTVSTFLEGLRREGALAGATAAQAYFVTCDDSNNPAAATDAGRLIIDVGVAPSIPMEFVIFRIGRTADELEMVER